MEESQTANLIGREAFAKWKTEIKQNIYTIDTDYQHSIQFHFPGDFARIQIELEKFGGMVVNKLEPLVQENNLANNLPYMNYYDSIGNRIDEVHHHPTYVEAGDVIYQSNLLAKMANPGGLSECLSLLFLSAQAGEAGHNCPIACSAGIIRVLQETADFPQKNFYLEKLITPSYQHNFTGAQFLTEIQGGSDVGLNATRAEQMEENVWSIHGEKWFCSNAGADLIFTTARYDDNSTGTKGLALFLIPARWDGHKNDYTIRRLKDKIGTRSMATGEIDFHGARAIQIGKLTESFHLVMDNVLHLSRLFNTFCVLGMARRAYHIAKEYAKHRIAFDHPIIQYPLVKEKLARIKTENTAMLAAVFITTKLQDEIDKQQSADNDQKLLLRLLVNMQKYLSALWSVQHIHHALDTLAGNGTIESFSSIPRLLRDCIVCENWEGTHNVLQMQILKDIHKYKIDHVFINYMESAFANLDQKDSYVIKLVSRLKNIKQAVDEFQQLKPNQQALQIRQLVDDMVILFCAYALYMEAYSQSKINHSHSKLNCCDYFFKLHMDTNKLIYDDQYFELIDNICV